MAHTPGPWRVFAVESDYPGIEADCDETVVLWGHRHEDSGVRGDEKETRLANAHLIAASPDLLAACKAISEDLRGRIEDGARFNPGTLTAIAMVNAAIAKAEPTP